MASFFFIIFLQKMKIALLGYGRMGKEIERIALERGHQISLIIDIHNQDDIKKTQPGMIDVAIDFSTPHSAYQNILNCFEADIPVVCGTTGWLDHFDEIKKTCEDKKKCLFYASNYSVGVNIFFKLNAWLAKVMNRYKEYEVGITEIHHIHKLDAPSGTAITLAENILTNLNNKNKWLLSPAVSEEAISITAIRENEVPGIHTTKYESDVDYIELTHSAKNRIGFALGAVLAAEFINGKRGLYGMDDLLEI